MARLALFDLDHTLIDTTAAFQRFAEEFAARHGLDGEAVEWLVAVGGDGYLMTRQELFCAARERYGVPGTVEELVASYRKRMPDLVAVEQPVLDGLAALRDAGWRLAIVTNGEAGNQTGKVERTGLAAAVDAVVISGVLGVAKPDPEIFRVAVERAGGLPADGGWMVGDNLPNDIGGAAAVGLRTIWIEGESADPRPVPERKPDHTVGDVVAAIELLLAL